MLVGYTGVGPPVFDMFAGRYALRRAQGVVSTGRPRGHAPRPRLSRAKSRTCGQTSGSVPAGELRIAASLPDAAVLMRELQDFRVCYSDAGNATFNAREGAHNDLVLALALAVFGLSLPERVRDVPVVWSL